MRYLREILKAAICCGALLTSGALPGTAAETGSGYWVAPGAASGGDGSPDRPWPSLRAAFESGVLQGGDRITLAPGSYGRLAVEDRHFDPPLTITAGPEGGAHLDRLRVRGSSGLVFRGFDVWPRPAAETGPPQTMLVATDKASRNITFAEFDIRSTEDAASYPDWDRDTWKANFYSGVNLHGAGSALIDSRLTAVAHGVGVRGAGSRVIGNEILGFSMDGMRIFGAGTVVRGNSIRDCVRINANHDDGIQSWAESRAQADAVRDVTIDANRIIEWTGPEDHPFQCKLQGIGLFDGPYDNWTITNNLIAVRAHHGIMLGNMRNARVINNTVVNIESLTGKEPWIALGKRSLDGSNILRNNVTNWMKAPSPDIRAELTATNVQVKSYHRYFEDPENLDFRPRRGGLLVDRADASVAPPQDLEGRARPQGSGVDFGAFERAGDAP